MPRIIGEFLYLYYRILLHLPFLPRPCSPFVYEVSVSFFRTVCILDVYSVLAMCTLGALARSMFFRAFH